MFSSFGNTVFLIKLTQKLLEERSHRMIVNARLLLITIFIQNGIDAKVDTIVGELLYQTAQATSITQVIHLLFQLKLLNNVLHVTAKSIKILQKVLFQADGVSLTAKRLHGKT